MCKTILDKMLFISMHMIRQRNTTHLRCAPHLAPVVSADRVQALHHVVRCGTVHTPLLITQKHINHS